MSLTDMNCDISSKPYWGPVNWSHRLFDSIFKITVDAPANVPVGRINIKNSKLWTRVLNQRDDEGDAKTIEKLFLNECVLECPTKSADWFQSKMSEGATTAETGDPRDIFWLLIISLLAASADEESLGETYYRTRLAEIIEVQDERVTKFGLDNLPRMWEALAEKTLELAMTAEDSYRRLELPDPGHETRIGYSKKLTFPVQKDLAKFKQAVEGYQKDETTNPSPMRLCKLLQAGPPQGSFTARFLEAVKEFLKKLRSGNDGYNDPIWLTFREIVEWEPQEQVATVTEGTVSDIKLVMYLNYEVEFTLVSKTSATELGGSASWNTIQGEFKSELDVSCESVEKWFDHLFDAGKELSATGAIPKELTECWEKGLFVFQKSECGEWVAQRNCTQKNDFVHLLAHGGRLAHVKTVMGSEFPNDQVAVCEELPADFQLIKVDVDILKECLRSSSDRSAKDDVLEWFVSGVSTPKLRFDGLLKQGGSYFFSQAIPIQIHCDNWENCSVNRIGSDNSWAPNELHKDQEHLNFILKPGSNDSLEDDVVLKIRVNDSSNVGHKEISLTTQCEIDPVFKTPTDRPRKRKETAQGQLGPVDSDEICSSVSDNPVVFSDDMIPAFAPIGVNGDRRGIESLSQWRTLDQYLGIYADLLESIAVAGTCRKRLQYKYLLTWIRNIYPSCFYEVFASLQDNGFINKWYPTNHYLPLYWVPTPSLLRMDEDVVRLIGIVPYYQRNRLIILCEQHSVEAAVAVIKESEILGAIELKETTPEFIQDLRTEFGWELSSVDAQPLSSPKDVLSVSLKGRHENANAENHLIWKWNKNKFVEILDRSDVPQISLQKYENQDRPNRFVIFDSETVLWATRSQDWAIFMLAVLEQKQLYSLSVSGDLCRSTDSHAFGRSLPEPVGRYVLSNGAGVSGPIQSDAGNTYVHCFGNKTRALDCCENWVVPGDLESIPEVSLSFDPLSGEYPLDVYFTGQATGRVKNWLWDFGDGSSSTDQNPTHRYTSAGEYMIRLTVVCRGGEGRAQREISVEEPAPQACFDMDPITGPYPLTVQFSDLSTGLVETRKWEFGDGHSSGEKAPSHTFDQPGDYRISFKVMGPGGSSVIENLLEVKEHSPSVHFKASTLSGVAPLKVQFQKTTFGKVDSWEWDFGDGCHSNEANPLHVYANPGAFIVRLAVIGPGGRHEYTSPGPITVAEFAEAPKVVISPIEGRAPLTVTLSHDFLESIDGILWSFGDEEWAEHAAESHQYRNPGEYSGSLLIESKALRGGGCEVPFNVVVRESDQALDGENNNTEPNKNKTKRRTRPKLKKLVMEKGTQLLDFLLLLLTGRKKQDR
jgi:PKD repeat protein